MSKAADRSTKKHSSVVLAFQTETEAKKALRGRLIIAGTSMRTTEYQEAKPTDQCLKCQRYGHSFHKCRNQAKCQYCGGQHSTRDHLCLSCKERGPYIHISPKCVNCQGNHTVNS